MAIWQLIAFIARAIWDCPLTVPSGPHNLLQLGDQETERNRVILRVGETETLPEGAEVTAVREGLVLFQQRRKKGGWRTEIIS